MMARVVTAPFTDAHPVERAFAALAHEPTRIRKWR